MRSNPNLVPHAVRPDIRPASKKLRRDDSDGSANSGTDFAGVDYSPFSSDYTSTTQRSASLELLSSFSSHRATSPSSSVTTPISSPADMDNDDEDDDIRKAVFSPCADDLLAPCGAGYLDTAMLPSFPPLSKQAMSLQNSPRIFVRGIDVDDDDKPRRRGDLIPRMDALHLDHPQPRSPAHRILTSREV